MWSILENVPCALENKVYSAISLQQFLCKSQSVNCSVVWDSATPWTVAHQASLSMGLSWWEYWSELPFPPPGESSQHRNRACVSCLAGRLFTVSHLGSPYNHVPIRKSLWASEKGSMTLAGTSCSLFCDLIATYCSTNHIAVLPMIHVFIYLDRL